MFVKHEITFDEMTDFLWGAAREKWIDATDEQREVVWDMLEDSFADEVPEETTINDAVAYDCDDIFFPEDEYKESLKRKKLEESSVEFGSPSNLMERINLYSNSVFDVDYDVASKCDKTAADWAWDQSDKFKRDDPEFIENLKLASSRNPRNNPLFDDLVKHLKSTGVSQKDIDALKSGLIRVLASNATAMLSGYGIKLSREDRKNYFTKESLNRNKLESRIKRLEKLISHR